MHVLIEFWRARPAWSELSDCDREAYVERLTPAIHQLLSGGVQLLAMEPAGETAQANRDYDYWAVWQLPYQDQLAAFSLALDKVGWYRYFERVLTDVEATTTDDIFGVPEELRSAGGW